jgi:uncharacterized membrane protein YccC
MKACHDRAFVILVSTRCFGLRAADVCSGNAGTLHCVLARHAAPYWTMTSVYITSNPLTGATGSRARYRMLGTLIGAAGTIVLVPNLVSAPELLSLAIALWVGVFLYFSLIDGTPRAYVFNTPAQWLPRTPSATD